MRCWISVVESGMFDLEYERWNVEFGTRDAKCGM